MTTYIYILFRINNFCRFPFTLLLEKLEIDLRIQTITTFMKNSFVNVRSSQIEQINLYMLYISTLENFVRVFYVFKSTITLNYKITDGH